MNLLVVINHACDSVHTEESSKVTAKPEGRRICSEAQAIVNSICNYLCGWKSIVQVKVVCGSNEAPREMYELTGANLDRRSARMWRTQ